MTTANPPAERVRIKGPGQIAASVPHLLGFHPSDSLVVLSLRRPRGEIALTMRFDLTGAPPTSRFATEVALRLRASGADEAMLVCYPGDPAADLDVGSRHDLPHADLLGAVVERVADHDIEVHNALVVAAGRWRTYLCDDDCCRASAPVPEVPAHLAAAHAVRGLVVLEDRAAVVRSLQPLGGVARVAMQQAYDRLDEALTARVVGGESVADVRRESSALFDAALARFADPRTRLTDDETARLVLGLEDVHVRDAVIAGSQQRHDECVALLTHLARRTYPPDDAPVCTTLAWVLYLDGRGMPARVALERALRSDPGYTLATLLDEAIERQVPPSAVRRATRDLHHQSPPTPRRQRRKR